MKKKEFYIKIPVYLIEYDSFNPYFNMATDEYLLSLCEEGKLPFIVRLYSWNNECFTIGYYFKKKHLNIEKIKKEKFTIIRRITGGNLLYHKNELSFSFVGNKDLLKIYTVKEIYFYFANLLIEMLNNMNISAFINKANNKKNYYICYDSISQYEIGNGKTKIIASAQKVLKNSFLQHGSIFFDYNYKKVARYIKSWDLKIKYKLKSFCNNKGIEVDNKFFIVQIFKETLNRYFDILQYNLNNTDLKNINYLINEKYSKDEWNFRK